MIQVLNKQFEIIGFFMELSKLAIEGGSPVRSEPMPNRALIGQEEKAAAIKLFDEAIASGNAFGYGGSHEQQYEKDFVDFMGGGSADGVNSGTNAVFVPWAVCS